MITRVALALLSLQIASAVPPNYEIVFFDLPEALEPNPIPSPTIDLENLPGYPVDPNQLTLAGVVYEPDPMVHGEGPYPTIVILHGSGGLWSLDDIANGPASQFEDWAEVLCDRGYLCFLPDSFNPRGIPEHFRGRRPHHDPVFDDTLCSPNYERPKDLIASLGYLDTRQDVDMDRIGLLAFSHGAQTGLNALLDASVDLSPYTVDETQPNNSTDPLVVPDPVRIPPELPIPKACAFYYPGCGHFGYHGQASSEAAGRYMLDRRTRAIMFHGTEDGLMGSLYPLRFVRSSGLQADAEGVPNPIEAHFIFDQVEHSFDGETIADPQDWNTQAESPDEKAKRLARAEVMKLFAMELQPPKAEVIPDPMDDALKRYAWQGDQYLNYQVEACNDLEMWIDQGNSIEGTDSEISVNFPLNDPKNYFLRLGYRMKPAPIEEPENTGFFISYEDLEE